MKTLPTQPLSVIQLIILAIKSYGRIFPSIIWLVALSSVWHLIIPHLFLKNPAFAGVGMVGIILLTWFLYIVILAKSNIALNGGKMTNTAAFRLAKHRYLSVLGSNIIFFAVGIFTTLIIFSLNLLFDLVDLHPIYLILSISLKAVIFVYLYFAIPEIALEKISIVSGFIKSMRLVKNNWWRTFIVLAFTAAVILGFEALGILFTGKDRMFLFTSYHFILQCIFYPLIIATTLILLNDLKLRAAQG